MISYALTLFSMLGATLIPIYVALYLVTNLRFVKTRYIAAAGIGLAFWWYYDTMGDAVALDSNSTIYPFDQFGGIAHYAIILTFVAGIFALALFDYFAVSSRLARSEGIRIQGGSNSGSPMSARSLILIPVAVAAVMGIHGLAEGWDFADSAAAVTNQGIVDAFGGWNALISYPMHKFFEGAIVAAVYVAFVGRTNTGISESKWVIPVLGLLLGFTSFVGASIGYYVSFDTAYFFAFGVAAALYAIPRLAEALNQNFQVGINAPSFYGWKTFLALGVGFFLLYLAALFH